MVPSIAGHDGQLLITVAGAVVVWMLTGDANAPGIEPDRELELRIVKEMLSFLGQVEGQTMDRLMEALLGDAWSRAGKILKLQWPAVRAVATALTAERRLNGDSVGALIAGATPR